MKKLQKLMITLFSCIVIISSLAAFSACGGISGGGTKPQDEIRHTSEDDIIIGSWYSDEGIEEISQTNVNGQLYNINTKLLYVITYSSDKTAQYTLTCYQRSYRQFAPDQGENNNETSYTLRVRCKKVVYINNQKELEWTNVEEGQYEIKGKLFPGHDYGMNVPTYHFILDDSNTLSVYQVTGNVRDDEGYVVQGTVSQEPTLTFKRTTITLEEFQSLNVIPE